MSTKKPIRLDIGRMPILGKEPMKDFFVSFNKDDRAWADWIAWTLEEAKYEVVYQPWDFRPGGNFVLEMQKAANETRKTLMVLSDSYLKALYTQPEWAAAFAGDPTGESRKLIPLRVAQCSPTGMLKALIHADLVGLSADEAKAALLTAVADARPKPSRPPVFPGRRQKRVQSYAVRSQPEPLFPGRAGGSGALAVWREKLEFLLEQEPLVVVPDHKFALGKQIEEAKKKIQELGG